MASRARRKRQLTLLELAPKELLTQALFDDWYYDLPDELAYKSELLATIRVEGHT